MRKLPEGFGGGHKFARKGSEDHVNHLKTMDKHIKLHNQDWKNVIVCNMHPFPIQQHFGDAGLVTIRPCRDGEPYYAHHITMYRITKSDQGDGKWEPIEILPVEMAQEIVKKYAIQGGVFWHFEDEPVPVETMKEAAARQINYYRALVRKGRDEWTKYHSMVRIADSMRQAARYLAKQGEININDFEWVEKTKQPVCPQCGEDHKPEAKVCKVCEFPLNVAWVRQFRKDLVAKYGLGEAQAGDAAPEFDEKPVSAESFLDESLSVDDAKLLGGN